MSRIYHHEPAPLWIHIMGGILGAVVVVLVGWQGYQRKIDNRMKGPGMKKIKIAVAIVTISLTSNAHAEMRLENGKVLIETGEPVSKIHKYIKPVKSYSGKVCKEPSAMSCRRKGSTYGRIYEYETNNVTYIVETNGGKITYMTWRY